MQTHLADFIKQTDAGREADAILRSCVHCGFCNATCPTYQILGDELDGPRGRIYLIKQILEGHPVTEHTQRHLDRCLTCLNCETTCPSGVQYGKLLELGRSQVGQRVKRSIGSRALRYLLLNIVPYPNRFKWFTRLGKVFSPLLPKPLKNKLPNPNPSSIDAETLQPVPDRSRKMILLGACVQQQFQPSINHSAKKILNKLNIDIIPIKEERCCGAMSHHLDAKKQTLQMIRQNIDAWWPHIESGAEAIVSTASACGLMIKDYGHLMRKDKRYARKAERIATLTRDISEVIASEDLSLLNIKSSERIAFHPPCTLQHGQQLSGVVEKILSELGFDLLPVANRHLCCGSAGTYSLFQPTLADQLKDNKLRSLQANKPEIIATANIGCQEHLRSNSQIPVVHWVELLD
jgi:glycolate oxidase iron-sulfur subunit